VVTSIIDSKYVVTTFSDKALPGIFVGNIEKHEIQNTDLTNLVKEHPMPLNRNINQGHVQSLIDGVFQQIDAIAENLSFDEACNDSRIIKLMNLIHKLSKEKASL